jgi:hypothetical protein
MMSKALSEIPPRELHLLYALAGMCEQYMSEQFEGRTVLDHMWMGAGEEAYKAFLAYGLIEVAGREATWTNLGLELSDLRANQQPFPSRSQG